jgi:hypothetical protein
MGRGLVAGSLGRHSGRTSGASERRNPVPTDLAVSHGCQKEGQRLLDARLRGHDTECAAAALRHQRRWRRMRVRLYADFMLTRTAGGSAMAAINPAKK